MLYHLKSGEQILGPWPLSQIHADVVAGNLSAERCLIRNPKTDEWVPLDQVLADLERRRQPPQSRGHRLLDFTWRLVRLAGLMALVVVPSLIPVIGLFISLLIVFASSGQLSRPGKDGSHLRGINTFFTLLFAGIAFLHVVVYFLIYAYWKLRLRHG